WTGINSCAQHKVCRKDKTAVYSGNTYNPVFQRLSEYLQASSGKFRHFIQKQYSSVRQRNLSRLRIPAASGQRSCRTGMMRTPERPAADERVFLRQKSGNTVYFRQFQAFSITQKRHDTRYPLCSHGLACSRLTDHQEL